MGRFFAYLEGVRGYSAHTIRNYKIDLKDFFAKMGDEVVDKSRLRQYLAGLYRENLAKKTIARKLSTLRSFFKFLVKEGAILKNPMLEIETPKMAKSLPKTLTAGQIIDFFSLPDVEDFLGFRDRTIMELLYSTGIRISELTQLNRGDFYQKEFFLKVRGKGNKERVVPVTSIAAEYLRKYLEHPERGLDGKKHKRQKDQQAVFLNRWGKRITVRSVDRIFERYRVKADIAISVTPHTMRHSIATHLLENGMDLKAIQEILGHTTLMATTVYTEVSSTLKREIYHKAHPLAKE